MHLHPCLCGLPLCCTKLHLILRFARCGGCLWVSLVFSARGLHPNKPANMHVCAAVCLPKIYVWTQCSPTATTAAPRQHTHGIAGCNKARKRKYKHRKFCIFLRGFKNARSSKELKNLHGHTLSRRNDIIKRLHNYTLGADGGYADPVTHCQSQGKYLGIFQTGLCSRALNKNQKWVA